MVTALQAHQEDSNNDSSLSNEDGDAHFQYACAAIEATNPKVATALKSHKVLDLDLRSVWLLDNQSTFDLCCNPDFSGKRHNVNRAMNMSISGGGLQNSKECMVPGYDFWVWFTTRPLYHRYYRHQGQDIPGIWSCLFYIHYRIIQRYILSPPCLHLFALFYTFPLPLPNVDLTMAFAEQLSWTPGTKNCKSNDF